VRRWGRGVKCEGRASNDVIRIEPAVHLCALERKATNTKVSVDTIV